MITELQPLEGEDMDSVVSMAADEIVSSRPPPKTPKPKKQRVSKPRPTTYSTASYRRKLVISALRQFPHGLTISHLSSTTGIRCLDTLRKIVKEEAGVSIFINYWHKVKNKDVPVYALCECPEDCPKPE